MKKEIKDEETVDVFLVQKRLKEKILKQIDAFENEFFLLNTVAKAQNQDSYWLGIKNSLYKLYIEVDLIFDTLEIPDSMIVHEKLWEFVGAKKLIFKKDFSIGKESDTNDNS